LIQKKEYLESDKKEMLKIMKRNGLIFGQSKFIVLRKIRGQLVKKPRNKPTEIVATGRDDWIGWFELKHQTVNERAIENTARVIHEIDANVLCVVEAENRIALNRFNSYMIPKVGGQEYDHIMLIDGNDLRGIDVGIMTHQQYNIHSMKSHVDDTDTEGNVIFSRDCPEFEITTPSGNILLVMINHFKSKGYGKPEESDAKRKRQARRVREIYEERVDGGYEFIAIVGDLNDNPDKDPLKPLLEEGSKLIDVMEHDKFISDGRPGTYLNGNASGKLDYILMSPELSSKVQKCGIERRGVWGGKNGTLFPHFPEIKGLKDAASDHAALWVDFEL
jgi:endonuclease/exonuclease/phosphatase family metal-dependent hydrolase